MKNKQDSLCTEACKSSATMQKHGGFARFGNSEAAPGFRIRKCFVLYTRTKVLNEALEQIREERQPVPEACKSCLSTQKKIQCSNKAQGHAKAIAQLRKKQQFGPCLYCLVIDYHL